MKVQIPMFDCLVTITEDDFDVAVLQADILQGSENAGAVASFVGVVRGVDSGQVDGDAGAIGAIELEHYPGMTESSISEIVSQAATRWQLLAARVVHRIGRLLPGEQIVYVGVSSMHRRDAFDACEFIMDYLKTQAPLWKKEEFEDGSRWVDARDSEATAAARWAEQDEAIN